MGTGGIWFFKHGELPLFHHPTKSPILACLGNRVCGLAARLACKQAAASGWGVPPLDRPIIRPLTPGEASECERIPRELPGWFGIPSAIEEYRRSLDHLDTYVALVDGRVAGFLALKLLTPATAEIHVMAMGRKYHRRGIGRALVEAAERWALERSFEYLTVETLGPSREDPDYHQTRQFYLAVGFAPPPVSSWSSTFAAMPTRLELRSMNPRRDRACARKEVFVP